MKTNLNDYINKIGLGDEKRTILRPEELQKILIKKLEEYFNGKESMEFVIGLASAIYPEAHVEGNIQLISATCLIDDLQFMKPPPTKEKIEETFKKALKKLK